MDWFQTYLIIFSILLSTNYLNDKINENTKMKNERTDKLYEMYTDLFKDKK